MVVLCYGGYGVQVLIYSTARVYMGMDGWMDGWTDGCQICERIMQYSMHIYVIFNNVLSITAKNIPLNKEDTM